MTTAGALLTTILGLTLGQASPPPNDVFFTNQRNHSVPVNVPPAARAEIRELRLFASRDQGTSWQQVAVIGSDKSAFAFYAPTDGSYWLRVATVNQKNVQQPENLYDGPPNIKMVIDSLKPLVRLSAPQRVGNEVVVSWELQEDHPDWSTFQVEWQTKDAAASWTKANANPGLSGQARFIPNTQGPVIVRLQLRDMAGNMQMAVAEMGGTAAIAAAPGGTNDLVRTQFTPPAPAPLSTPTPLPPPSAPMGLSSPEASPNLGGAVIANSVPTPAPLPPAGPSGLPGAPNGVVAPAVEPKSFTTTPPENAAPLPPFPNNSLPLANTNPPLPSNNPPTVPQQPAPPMPPVPQPNKQVAQPFAGPESSFSPKANPSAETPAEPMEETKIIARTDGAVQSASTTVSQRQTLPPLMYVNNPEVTLEYELAKVGPSGVASIELWRTQNDGKTWEMYAFEPSVEAKPGRHQSVVPLPGDGVFGFILIVKSKAGLGRRPPRAGDAPEIRVEVDTEAPIAQLAQPVVDPHRNNSLLLRWAAKDKNLAPTPITLEWAEKREGPWSPIATNLGNTGRHSWQLPDRLPISVYLRLRVKDLAGNEAIAVSLEPQNVDLSEPEGRLLNAFVTPRK